MATVVLIFQGDADRFEAAVARLRVELPGSSFARKTSTAVEAQLEDSQLAVLQASPEWTVRPMVYADAKPPGPNLGRMRSKLQQLETSRQPRPLEQLVTDMPDVGEDSDFARSRD